MARDRRELGQKLKDIIGDNVYFQPPANIHMQYPCAIYRLTNVDILHADNIPYAAGRRYQITFITQNPDPGFIDSMMIFPTCRFDRLYTGDNLYHYVFELYY